MSEAPFHLAGQGQTAGLIPPGSTAFYLLLAIHIAAALTCVVTGALPALSPKRPGRHPRLGTLYHRSLTVVVASAAWLAAPHWPQDAYLLVLGTLALAAATLGRTARRRRWRWLGQGAPPPQAGPPSAPPHLGVPTRGRPSTSTAASGHAPASVSQNPGATMAAACWRHGARCRHLLVLGVADEGSFCAALDRRQPATTDRPAGRADQPPVAGEATCRGGIGTGHPGFGGPLDDPTPSVGPKPQSGG